MQVYRMNTEKSYMSGKIVQDDEGNRFEVLSCMDLEWLLGEEDFKKSEYKHKYYLSLKFIGNFKPLEKEKEESPKKEEPNNNERITQ